MKKSFLLTTLLILTINFSCQEQESTVEPKANLKEVSAFLSEMFTNTISHTVENIKLSENKGNVELNNPDIITNYLTENYFPELSGRINFTPTTNARTSADDEHFTDAQLLFISDMDKAMANIRSAQNLQTVIDQFRSRAINNLSMSDEQKIEMLAIVEYSNSLHDYLVNGGVSEFIEILPESNGSISNGRVENGDEYEIFNCQVTEDNPSCSGGSSGCSVNWRSVWGSAVVGLAYGATTGAIAGGTAGTVVFPVVGTVTGAVSAGVVGGAIGFIEGAALGVVGNLLLTCGR